MRDTNPATNEAHKLTLGWAEKGIAAVLLAAVVGVPAYIWNKAEAKSEKQGELLAAMDTRTQVMATQMTAISTQMADVPALRVQVTELKVQQNRNTQDIAELRAMKGLR